MRLPWRKKSKSDPGDAHDSVQEPRGAASFGGDLLDFTVLRHHAIRALCGALMERHTACRSPHPFCGIRGHQRDGDTHAMLIAEAIPQGAAGASTPDLIGIYLTGATAAPAKEGGGEEDIMEYITRMNPAQPVPWRKLVVYPPESGTYPAVYGPILNPVDGNYSAGSIDPENARPLTCNPEPRHCRWRYWESDLTRGNRMVPRFHCLQVFGQWWVVDVDLRRGAFKQVAGFDVADNPEHNYGIHEVKGQIVLSGGPAPNDEFVKVIIENGGSILD